MLEIAPSSRPSAIGADIRAPHSPRFPFSHASAREKGNLCVNLAPVGEGGDPPVKVTDLREISVFGDRWVPAFAGMTTTWRALHKRQSPDKCSTSPRISPPLK